MVIVRWMVLLLVGCNQVFGLDNTVPHTPDAAIDAPGCAGSQFQNAQPMPGVPYPSYAPWLVSPLELWTVRQTGPNGLDVFIATRTDPTQPFGAPNPAPGAVNSSADDSDFALTADGLDMVLLRDTQILEGKRATTSDAFTGFAPVPELVNFNAQAGGVWLSPDGTTLYYSDGMLHVRHRATRSSSFGADSVIASAVVWPGLSPDEIELYFSDTSTPQTTIARRVRTATTIGFPDATSNQTIVQGDDSMVYANPDGTQWLVYQYGSGTVSFMTRACR